MTIQLNGNAFAIEEEQLTVAQLVEKLSVNGPPLLIERNGRAVLVSEFDQEPVEEGDIIEAIRMVAGG